MNCTPVCGEKWFCVLRRVSLCEVACFYKSVSLKAFLSIFIIILSSFVNWRNEKQKLHKEICRNLWGKRVKLQCLKIETRRLHATEPQIYNMLIIHPLQSFLCSYGRISINDANINKKFKAQGQKLTKKC